MSPLGRDSLVWYVLGSGQCLIVSEMTADNHAFLSMSKSTSDTDEQEKWKTIGEEFYHALAGEFHGEPVLKITIE